MPQTETPTAAPQAAQGVPAAPADGGDDRISGLLDRLFTAMKNAVDLRIVTVVGDFTVEGFDDPDKPLRVMLGAEQGGLFTSINLVTGDIRCALSKEYTGAQNTDLQAFHAKQVELARDIVANNLKVLGDLAEKFGGYLQRRAEGGG